MSSDGDNKDEGEDDEFDLKTLVGLVDVCVHIFYWILAAHACSMLLDVALLKAARFVLHVSLTIIVFTTKRRNEVVFSLHQSTLTNGSV